MSLFFDTQSPRGNGRIRESAYSTYRKSWTVFQVVTWGTSPSTGSQAGCSECKLRLLQVPTIFSRLKFIQGVDGCNPVPSAGMDRETSAIQFGRSTPHTRLPAPDFKMIGRFLQRAELKKNVVHEGAPHGRAKLPNPIFCSHSVFMCTDEIF